MTRTRAATSRRTVRSVLAAGLACLISGPALAVGALLPTAMAAVDPEGPTQGDIVNCATHGFTESQGHPANLRSTTGGSVENDFFRGTWDDTTNMLDIEDLDPADNVAVAGVIVDGPRPAGEPSGYFYVFRGMPTLQGDGLLDMYAPWDADGNPDEKDMFPPANHWLLCAVEVDEPTTPPTSPTPSIELSVLEPVCDNDVPYLEYEIIAQDFTPTEVTITWVNPVGDDVVYEDVPLSGRVLWAGAVVDEDGNPLDWPGWTQLPDGTWVEGDEFDWVRPSVEVVFSVNPDVSVTVDYPPSSPVCNANPPEDEPTPAPTPTPPQPTLPDTGSSNGWLAVAGIGLLGIGGVLLAAGRRVARYQD
ncbi:MAG: LPXTG cell wall anchor domain-containing protein [Jiangellaceae bacterium]